jgi:hypothetical protein
MDIAIAILSLVLLLAGSGAGLVCQNLLKERHRNPETIESIRLVVTMLVTFAALVLGLLVTSVKADFDKHNDEYRAYGDYLIRLDARLREFGPEADQIRKSLRAFTASVILQSWPEETPPGGEYPKDFKPLFAGSDETQVITSQLHNIDNLIQNLSPQDTYHTRIYAKILEHLKQMQDVRWSLVEGCTSRVSSVFLTALMFWLVTVFFMFGMVVPRNGLVYLAVFLTSLSVASTLYIILDLDHPMDGYIKVSSQPLRGALIHMDQPVDHKVGHSM